MRPWAPGLSTDGAEKPTDGGGGSGYGDRPRGFVPLTWHFRTPAHVVISLVARLGPGLGVLGAEGVGDPLVSGISLAVDAVGVDLQQDRDTVPGPAGDLDRRHPSRRVSPPG